MKDIDQQIPSNDGIDVSGAPTEKIRTSMPAASPPAQAPLLIISALAVVLVICLTVAIRTVTSNLRRESERVIARITQAQASLSESQAASIQTASSLKRESERVIASITQAQASLSELQTAAFQSASAQQRTAIESARDDMLKCLAKDAGAAGSSANVAAKQAAAGQRALELGVKEIESGNTEKAILLFINGINHDPSRLELIRALADAAFTTDNGDIAERAIGVLELATIQVSPDDMPETLNQIARLRDKFAPSTVKTVSPEEALKQWQEIKDVYLPESIWLDSRLVGEGLSEIEFLGQQIDVSRTDGQDDRFASVLNECLELSASLQTVQTALPLFLHITNCISQMSAALNTATPDTALVSSLSASAQSLLAQIWGQMPHLPASMRSAFNKLPGQIHDKEVAFQQKASTPIHARAIEIIKRAEGNRAGTLTDRINRISSALDMAATNADLITARELRNDFFKEARAVRDSLLKLELERRYAYQRWALERVNGFMNDWNRQKIVNNDDAKKMFSKHQIAMIDETLIIPEVARILARVMACMTGELGAKDGSKAEFDFAASAKKRLEDF